MKNKITTVTLLLLAAFITIGGNTSCKSRQKAKEVAQAEYRIRVDNAIKDLNAILNDEVEWNLQEKEARVQTIKNWNLQNNDVDVLLLQVEKKLARERAQAEKDQKDAAVAGQGQVQVQGAAQQPASVLEKNLQSIATATNTTQANRIIAETLKLFESNQAPVLIVISHVGDIKDYDRPTTIEDYLNYVKDQKINRNKVSNLKLNAAGQITEVELIKK